MALQGYDLEERVIAVLREVPLVTLIREGPDGDLHVPLAYNSMPFGDEAGEVPALLEALEAAGRVQRTETPRNFDPTEYKCLWRLAPGAEARCRDSVADSQAGRSWDGTGNPDDVVDEEDVP